VEQSFGAISRTGAVNDIAGLLLETIMDGAVKRGIERREVASPIKSK
jgi:hypothetical protein